MHGRVTIFLVVIALAIILLVIGLDAPHVLVVALRAFVAPIVSMMIVRLSIIAITLVASMIVAMFITAMLRVAQFTAMCNRKLSRFPFLWLLVLGNLLENASLGWEFQFLVPISATPIVSGIPILFLILKIPVGFFF